MSQTSLNSRISTAPKQLSSNSIRDSCLYHVVYVTIANNLFFYYKLLLCFPKTISFIHRKRLHDIVLLLLPLKSQRRRMFIGRRKKFFFQVSQTLVMKHDILFIISLINVIFLKSIMVFSVDEFNLLRNLYVIVLL